MSSPATFWPWLTEVFSDANVANVAAKAADYWTHLLDLWYSRHVTQAGWFFWSTCDPCWRVRTFLQLISESEILYFLDPGGLSYTVCTSNEKNVCTTTDKNQNKNSKTL